ncbi:hypothetical protein RGQ29_030157 [Quercus rubra]|uniref:Uncharacterized protein n=1 Tax=Quercus rubra TaxID=3512 RepID=A0AAN7IDX1_QUERU|nr:hypothetical protein RGQ29_030157 [Quercus rubra]
MGFGGVIPYHLGNLSNLHYLNLEGNGLYVNNLQWLSGLPLLQHLNMSYVNLSIASNWLHDINKISSLLELQLLDCALRYIPSTPSVNFSSLTTLNLSSNHFENTLIPSWIFGLHNILSLDLFDNDFQGPIPIDLQNMTFLTHLDLPSNYFNSSIPNWLYSFIHFESLNLGSNKLHGSISNTVGNLTSIISIDQSYNELGGMLPRSLGNLCNLREIIFSFLDLSYNRFNRTFPQNVGQPSKLTNLYIESNMLNRVAFEVHFSNLTRLNIFNAFENQLTLDVRHNWIPPFQIEDLSLRSWNLGPKFPSWLCSQSHLWVLDISNTEILDIVPSSFWNLSSNFEFLNLSHNQIYGEIPNSQMILSTFSVIDLRSNHFKGPLPYIYLLM